MSTCYKCGCELPGTEVECEPACKPSPSDTALPKRLLENMRLMDIETKRMSLPIDWSKVKTIDDMRLIMSELYGEIRILKGSAAAVALKDFLGDDQRGAGPDSSNPS